MKPLKGQDKITEKDVILVTGGSGLFGKAIEEVVKKSGVKGKWVFGRSKDCDLTILDNVRKYFKEVKPTYVIHLAAHVGGLFRNSDHTERIDFWMKNVNMNNNVLLVCHEEKVTKCLSCMSTCIYPDGIKLPLTEKVLFDGPPHQSNEPYAYAKRMVGLLSKWMNEVPSIKTNYICCIPCNLFGKYDNFNIQQSHVIPGLIHKCYKAKEKNEKFVCWGTGKPLRQFLYTIDAARMTLLLLFNFQGDKHEPWVSICTGGDDEISIGEVYRTVAKCCDYDKKENLVYDTSKADGQYQKTTSNEKFMKLFPDFKFSNFHESLKETVDWFFKNYDEYPRK